jgi:hypothetical protein
MPREDGNSMTVWGCPALRGVTEAPSGRPGGGPQSSDAEPDYSLGDGAQIRHLSRREAASLCRVDPSNSGSGAGTANPGGASPRVSPLRPRLHTNATPSESTISDGHDALVCKQLNSDTQGLRLEWPFLPLKRPRRWAPNRPSWGGQRRSEGRAGTRSLRRIADGLCWLDSS